MNVKKYDMQELKNELHVLTGFREQERDHLRLMQEYPDTQDDKAAALSNVAKYDELIARVVKQIRKLARL